MSVSSDSDRHDLAFLDFCSEWLVSLAKDAGTLADVLRHDPEHPGCAALVGGLNYLFKSLDLIPDGIEDLGYLDDAFVLRVAAAHGVAAGLEEPALVALATQAKEVETFLGDDYARLVAFVERTRDGSVRGRSPLQILNDSALRSSFLSELDGWRGQYTNPSFTKEARTLVKLRSFLGAKLP